RMRPLAGPTLRAGAWNRTMRCYSLLVWIDHTASAAPSLARFQAPAQTRFSAAQAPRCAQPGRRAESANEAQIDPGRGRMPGGAGAWLRLLSRRGPRCLQGIDRAAATDDRRAFPGALSGGQPVHSRSRGAAPAAVARTEPAGQRDGAG